MSYTRQARLIEAMGISLFFVQAWRAVLSAAFGILYDYGFEGPLSAWSVGAVGLVAVALLAPLLPIRKRAPLAMMAAVLMACAARPMLNWNELMPRYWAGLIVLTAGAWYLTALIQSAPELVWPSLIGGLVVDQVLRALGDTYDPSLRPDFLPTQIAFSLALAALAIGLLIQVTRSRQAVDAPGGWRISQGVTIGAALFLLTSLFTLPNAVARWSNYEYAVIAPALVATMCALLFPQVRTGLRSLLGPGAQAMRVVVMSVGLTVGYLRWGIVSALGLMAACVVLLDSVAGACESRDEAHTDHTGPGLALGLLLLLVLNLALGFAFTYPYTLRLMQGMGLPVYLVAGLIVVGLSPVRSPSRFEGNGQGAMAFALLAITITLLAAFPISPDARNGAESVTAATYTIRYGYDNRWRYALEEISSAIEQSGADVVALQEVDTGRLTSFGTDDVYFLARRLRMHAYYLPTVERLTGIALLSRLPVVRAEGHLIASQQEQTGIAHMHLAAAGNDLHVYSTWLGIRGEDTSGQIAEVIARIGQNAPAVLGGSFNTEPDSSAYASIREAGFEFAAFGLGAPSPHVQAVNPAPHTDYLWLRGLTSLRGWLPRTPPTNHKMVAVRLTWP